MDVFIDNLATNLSKIKNYDPAKSAIDEILEFAGISRLRAHADKLEDEMEKPQNDVKQIEQLQSDYARIAARIIELTTEQILTPADLTKLTFPEKKTPEKIFPYLLPRPNVNPAAILGYNAQDPIRQIARIENKGYVPLSAIEVATAEGDVVHEQIPPDRPQLLVLDVDAPQDTMDVHGHTREEVVAKILHALYVVLNEHCEKYRGLDIFRYLAAATSSSPEKLSLHIIYRGEVFHNALETRAIAKMIKMQLGESFGIYIDIIQRNGHYSLRGIGNEKDERMKSPTLLSINNGFTHAEHYLVHPPNLNLSFLYHRQNILQYIGDIIDTAVDVTDVDVATMIALVTERNEGLEYRETSGRFVIFDRAPGEYKCAICKRSHGTAIKPGDGAFAWKWASRFYFRCRRSPEITTRLRKANDAPETKDVIKAIPQAVPPLKRKTFWQQVQEVVSTKFTNKFVRELYDLPNARRINMDAAALAVSEDVIPKLHFDKNVGDWVLLLRSPMGTGKTKLVDRRIDEGIERTPGKNVYIYVSYRVSLACAMYRILKKAGRKVLLYSDEKGPINTDKYDVIIIQVESLHRLNIGNRRAIVLILDEINSIERQTMSGLNKKKPAVTIHRCIAKLMKAAKYVIALDAFAHSSTERWLLAHKRTDATYTAIVNDFLPFEGNEIEIRTIGDAHREIFDDLNRGNRVVIAHTSKSGPYGAETTAKLIQTKGYTTKLYCGGMDETQKQDDLKNLEKAWKTCDAVIYTVLIEAGVSYEEKGFNTSYLMVDASTMINAESVIQMSRRVRNVDRRVVGLINTYNERATQSPDIDDIKSDIIRPMAMALVDIDRDHLTEFDEKTRTAILSKSTFVTSYIENEHTMRLSRRYFLQMLCFLLAIDGASLKCIERTESDKIKQLRREAKAVMMELSDEEVKDIENASDLTPDEVDALLKERNPTKPQSDSLNRFFLLSAYNADPEVLIRGWIRMWHPRAPRLAFRLLCQFRRAGTCQEVSPLNLLAQCTQSALMSYNRLNALAEEKNDDELDNYMDRYLREQRDTIPRICIAHLCLILLGFEGIDDTTVIPGETLNARVGEYNAIFHQIRKASAKLGVRDQSKEEKVSVKAAVDLTNKFLHCIGYKVKSDNSRRTKDKKEFDFMIDRTQPKAEAAFDSPGAPVLPGYSGPKWKESVEAAIYTTEHEENPELLPTLEEQIDEIMKLIKGSTGAAK